MTACALAALLAHPRSSWAVADVPTVINNLRNWILGLLTGLATLFLTFGGLRYLMAGGDPGEVEAAKRALKAAAIGYGLAILAPVLVTVLQSIVGAGT
ncbi:pilin [Streptomyces sp. NBC_01431]|uniref:pilin n=1 Tax=Streptomyces sp. NBC_01431 TaxID=2903863 RepID=UPI002E348F3D|nr:pilin [Streptomyces sp. NBC_01431]